MALSNKITNLMNELYDVCHYDGTQLFCCAIDKKDGSELDVTASDSTALMVMLAILAKYISEADGTTPVAAAKRAIKVAKKCGMYNYLENREEQK